MPVATWIDVCCGGEDWLDTGGLVLVASIGFCCLRLSSISLEKDSRCTSSRVAGSANGLSMEVQNRLRCLLCRRIATREAGRGSMPLAAVSPGRTLYHLEPALVLLILFSLVVHSELSYRCNVVRVSVSLRSSQLCGSRFGGVRGDSVQPSSSPIIVFFTTCGFCP
jgi:cobalamin synthase